MSNVKSVSEGSFDEQVLKSDRPVMVDFWAPWCGPCKALGPIVDTIAADNSNKLDVVKLNVDENQSLAVKYGVRGIPTIIVFNKGAEVKRVVGLQNKGQLQALVDSVAK